MRTITQYKTMHHYNIKFKNKMQIFMFLHTLFGACKRFVPVLLKTSHKKRKDWSVVSNVRGYPLLGNTGNVVRQVFWLSLGDFLC